MDYNIFPSNGQRFLAAFDRIQKRIGELAGVKGHRRFFDLIDIVADKGNGLVIAKRNVLKDYGDFRNAIAHTHQPGGGYIANPLDKVVKDIEEIANALECPRRASQIGTKLSKGSIYNAAVPLQDVLNDMGREGWSQVVVWTGMQHVLLSVEGVCRWLGAEGLVDVAEATTGEALTYEPDGTVVWKRADTSMFDVEAEFAKVRPDKKGRLMAVLVSPSGEPIERPHTIVTPWDLPALSNEAGSVRAWSTAGLNRNGST